MGRTEAETLLRTRVPPEVLDRVLELARAEYMTPAAWLRRLVCRTVEAPRLRTRRTLVKRRRGGA